MDKKTLIIVILVVVLAFVFGSLLFKGGGNSEQTAKTSNIEARKTVTATLYRSPNCGCCDNYLGALRSKGFQVKDVKVDDIRTVKEENNIPKSLESCHTVVMGDYIIEGHVPFEAIDKLLSEKPDIGGLALAGMPSGSPGMMGRKIEPLQVHSMGHDGEDLGVFMEL